MKRSHFSERIVANITFSERQPGVHDADEVVQFQMPEAVYRLFRAEARHRKIDLNTLVRDVICDALTERAEAIRRINAERDGETGE